MAAPATDRAIDLVTSSIEALIESRLLEKTGTSEHESRFAGYLGLWSSFESNVRHNTESISWNQHQSILQIRPANTPNALHHEHYICGDEKSISARMVQNVFQPLTAIGKELGHGIEWSDSKASSEGMAAKADVPDFVALANGRQLRLIGEAKTPWAHRIASAAANATSDVEIWRRFGQISKYMQKFDVKYGFYTTYQHTLFLKKERRGNEWVLWHSRPISNNTTSAGMNQNPTNLVDRVSLRECFLYLQTRIANNDWRSVNKSGDWHIGKKVGPVNFHKYYADDNPNTQPGTSGPMVPSLPAKQTPLRQSPRNPQPSTGVAKKRTSPERSTPRSGSQQRLIEPNHDEKSNSRDHSSASSRLGRDSATSSLRMFSLDRNYELRQSTSHGSENKGSRSNERSPRAYLAKHIQGRLGSSDGKSQPREKVRLPDARVQPSNDEISSLGNGMSNSGVQDTRRQRSTTETGRGKRSERNQTSNSSSESRAKLPMTDQSRPVQSGNRDIKEHRSRLSEQERRLRNRLANQSHLL